VWPVAVLVPARCRASVVGSDNRHLSGRQPRLSFAGTTTPRAVGTRPTATVVREEFYGEVLGHVVMLDPEGNEFCVA